METHEPKKGRTVAALIHLSTFSQFIFPFGNFLFPLIFWTAKRSDPFVDEHGKEALNFQISLFLYVMALLFFGFAGFLIYGFTIDSGETFFLIADSVEVGSLTEAMPLLIFEATVILLLVSLILLNIYAVISATIRAGEGEKYHYPLSINFIRFGIHHLNQSRNEQFQQPQNQTL